ncbi:MAG: thioredoxin family protein [Armatimonadota bacterium]
MRNTLVALVVVCLIGVAFPAVAQEAAADEPQAPDTPVQLMQQLREAMTAHSRGDTPDFNLQEHLIMPEDSVEQTKVMSAFTLLLMTSFAPEPHETTEATEDMAVVTMDPEPIPFVMKNVDGTWMIDLIATIDRLPDHVQEALEPGEEAMQQAQAQAQQSNCLANLKQLGLGAMMYAEDHDGTLPDADKWMDELEPYVKNEALLKCPASPDVEYGYAMNADLSGAGLDDIKSPADTVLFYDSTLGTRNASGSGDSLPAPPRHMQGNGVVFADGHATIAPGSPNFDIAAEAPASEVIHVTADDWEAEVLHADGYVLVDFGAEWCGPCKQLEPVYRQMSTEYENVKFVSVDTDESPELGDQYVERGIPTLILFEDGLELSRQVGFRDRQRLQTWLDDNLQ